MNQNQRRSRALFLIVEAHPVDNGEVAVGGIGNAGANVVERKVGWPRKPKDSQRNRRNQNQREQKFEDLFDQALKITLGKVTQQAPWANQLLYVRTSAQCTERRPRSGRMIIAQHFSWVSEPKLNQKAALAGDRIWSAVASVSATPLWIH